MQEACEQYRELISAYVDGELAAEDSVRLVEHVASCPVCQAELDDVTRLAAGTRALYSIRRVPDQALDGFVEGVYARLERRVGWWLLLAGLACLAVEGVFWFVTEPGTGMRTRALVAVPILGLIVLFVSVLRQRLRRARSDRYSREVFR